MGAIAAEYVPSVVALGQWTPLRALPGDLCRWRGPRANRIALTFDDGPDPDGTPAILDRLDELRLRATFFCLGVAAERAPELVEEILRRGHEVGVHGYAHRHHLLRSPKWIADDLAAADAALRRCGVDPRWYRPTYGQAGSSTLIAARRRGWRTVLWSAWGREWATDDPEDVASRVLARVGPGGIVLLHDSDAYGPPGMWKVALAALGAIADDLSRRRLDAVTLGELLAPGPR